MNTQPIFTDYRGRPIKPKVAHPERNKMLLAFLAGMVPFLLIAAATQINLATQVKGTLPVGNGGTGATSFTSNVLIKGAGGSPLAVSSVTDNGTIVTTTEPVDAQGTNGFITEIANAGSTGTTVNKLAKLTGAPSTAVITATSDTSGAVGVVIGGAGTTGSAQLAIAGQALCVADNATTAGDFVIIGSGTAGDCRDGGSSRPSSNQIVGIWLTTTTAGSNGTVYLFGSGTNGAAGFNFSDNETPGGAINGSNTTFTLAHIPSPSASLMLFKNGQELIAGGADFTLATSTITTTTAPATGDVLICSYRY